MDEAGSHAALTSALPLPDDGVPATVSVPHAAASLPALDPIFLTESPVVVRAKLQLQRDKLERLLHDQVIQKKVDKGGKVFVSPEAGANLPVDEVLSKAQQVVSPFAADTLESEPADATTAAAKSMGKGGGESSASETANDASHAQVTDQSADIPERSPQRGGAHETATVPTSAAGEADYQATRYPDSEYTPPSPGVGACLGTGGRRGWAPSVGAADDADDDDDGYEPELQLSFKAEPAAKPAAAHPVHVQSHIDEPAAPRPERVSPLTTTNYNDLHDAYRIDRQPSVDSRRDTRTRDIAGVAAAGQAAAAAGFHDIGSQRAPAAARRAHATGPVKRPVAQQHGDGDGDGLAVEPAATASGRAAQLYSPTRAYSSVRAEPYSPNAPACFMDVEAAPAQAQRGVSPAYTTAARRPDGADAARSSVAPRDAGHPGLDGEMPPPAAPVAARRVPIDGLQSQPRSAGRSGTPGRYVQAVRRAPSRLVSVMPEHEVAALNAPRGGRTPPVLVAPERARYQYVEEIPLDDEGYVYTSRARPREVVGPLRRDAYYDHLHSRVLYSPYPTPVRRAPRRVIVDQEGRRYVEADPEVEPEYFEPPVVHRRPLVSALPRRQEVLYDREGRPVPVSYARTPSGVGAFVAVEDLQPEHVEEYEAIAGPSGVPSVYSRPHARPRRDGGSSVYDARAASVLPAELEYAPPPQPMLANTPHLQQQQVSGRYDDPDSEVDRLHRRRIEQDEVVLPATASESLAYSGKHFRRPLRHESEQLVYRRHQDGDGDRGGGVSMAASPRLRLASRAGQYVAGPAAGSALAAPRVDSVRSLYPPRDAQR
ncbi:hypothetical protein KEM52_000904 [Ascosphaera acerosa]|nr:hypothetical protein KEM52_000904 [Ascosphaera acerosa]